MLENWQEQHLWLHQAATVYTALRPHIKLPKPGKLKCFNLPEIFGCIRGREVILRASYPDTSSPPTPWTSERGRKASPPKSFWKTKSWSITVKTRVAPWWVHWCGCTGLQQTFCFHQLAVLSVSHLQFKTLKIII